VANAWTWHEAADIHTFYPRENREKEGDLVWIGNWGDGERGEELREFLIEPVRRLGLKATVHGVRYPDAALAELASAGIEYRGWLPNYEAPQVFSGYRVTVHIPRRPYMQLLPGIPTIRPFEALACAIPLISAPWRDRENLFRPGQDYLIAHDSTEMTCLLGRVLSDSRIAESLARSGLETIRSRHTCGHRVDELLAICGAFTTEAAMEGVA
jgi:spore maturation protein CgeB